MAIKLVYKKRWEAGFSPGTIVCELVTHLHSFKLDDLLHKIRFSQCLSKISTNIHIHTYVYIYTICVHIHICICVLLVLISGCSFHWPTFTCLCLPKRSNANEETQYHQPSFCQLLGEVLSYRCFSLCLHN